jgi:hypothetical protein
MKKLITGAGAIKLLVGAWVLLIAALALFKFGSQYGLTVGSLVALLVLGAAATAVAEYVYKHRR